jgi:hypothetical protein
MVPLINDAANMFCDGWNDVFHMCTFSGEKYRGGYKTIVYYMADILLLWVSILWCWVNLYICLYLCLYIKIEMLIFII